MNGLKWRAWFKASRPPFYIATLIPLCIGWILAARETGWLLGRFLLVNCAAVMVHMATNLVNDYYDYLQGVDSGESIGGSRVLQEGTISLETLGRAILLLYGGATLIGLCVVITLNLWAMVPFLLFAVLSSYFYTAPPVRYGYYGLGELFVGINMGPLMVTCTYWTFSGRPDWAPLCVSVPIGFMVASILYYQSLPDMRTDARTGKRTLAVRLGRRGALVGLIVNWAAIYLSIIILVLTGYLPWPAMLSVLTVPVFVRLVRIVRKTEDWLELDKHGKYVRVLYFLNGGIIILALLV
jgi:1,4-dihydroxy-2-naphthoate octaprenyltransferase